MAVLALSKHAAIRANQRGITHQMIEDVLSNADVEAPVGGGCTVLRVSKQRLRDRTLKGHVTTRPEKLASLALVWSDEAAEVVTLLVDHGGAKGRRYRARH
ncbi:DUF4258 domain-containing protein [Phenylobacterium sp.]|uniref:DUF4258 domain-containing protein n=1 Tax=Phenylobacterium sp. TaxID=1871053 RepID=UPI0035AEBEBB